MAAPDAGLLLVDEASGRCRPAVSANGPGPSGGKSSFPNSPARVGTPAASLAPCRTTEPAVVPEPASLAVLGLGLVGLAARRARKRRVA